MNDIRYDEDSRYPVHAYDLEGIMTGSHVARSSHATSLCSAVSTPVAALTDEFTASWGQMCGNCKHSLNRRKVNWRGLRT